MTIGEIREAEKAKICRAENWWEEPGIEPSGNYDLITIGAPAELGYIKIQLAIGKGFLWIPGVSGTESRKATHTNEKDYSTRILERWYKNA